MFGFEIYYRKKRIRISEGYIILVTLYSRLRKSCSDLLGLTRHSQSSYSFKFQVFHNVLLNLILMKVPVHSPLNQALNQSLLNDFLHTFISRDFFHISIVVFSLKFLTQS